MKYIAINLKLFSENLHLDGKCKYYSVRLMKEYIQICFSYMDVGYIYSKFY